MRGEESWKFQWMRLCHARRGTKKQCSPQETEERRFVNPTRSKTNHACIVEAHEPTRQRLESSLPKGHEDHIAGRGDTPILLTIWLTSLFLCLKRWKFRMRKQQWTRNWRSLRRPPGSWRKSKARRRLFWKHKEKNEVDIATLVDICHLKKMRS